MRELLDINKTLFSQNITSNSMDKYNNGDLFGLKVKSFSVIYPCVNGDTGDLKGTIRIKNIGDFNVPVYMLFKRIDYNLAQDMVTGKYFFICSNKDEVYNYFDIAGFDKYNLTGLSKYYFLVDKAINRELPFLAINTQENVIDIAEDYKINPVNTFIDAVDVYKKIIAKETLPRKDELLLIEKHIEDKALSLINKQYKECVSIAYDLAVTDNMIYDTENKSKKM